VHEKSLEIRHFLVLPYWEKAEQAPSWAAGIAREEMRERVGANEGGLMYNRRRPGSYN
jgi:hypothetical protein